MTWDWTESLTRIYEFFLGINTMFLNHSWSLLKLDLVDLRPENPYWDPPTYTFYLVTRDGSEFVYRGTEGPNSTFINSFTF